MSNHCNRRLACSLVIDAIDNLEQVSRARELTCILQDANLKTEQQSNKAEILLESYEKMRDEPLEAALNNLRELVRILC